MNAAPDPPLEPSAAAAQAAIAEEFGYFSDWSERYQYLIDLGRKLPAFPDALKAEENRLLGCQSMVWIVADGEAQRLDFRAISDSAIVSGLIFLALRVYSGRSATEILATEPDYIADIGLAKHLSPTRSNGLAALLGFIQNHARASSRRPDAPDPFVQDFSTVQPALSYTRDAMTKPPPDDHDTSTPPNSRRALDALLNQMIEHPERNLEIAAEVEACFGQDQATLILDMTGFTRTTRTHGIVSFLLMIHQMHRMTCPSIAAHGGKLIKTEADNLFCLFDSVPAALASARDIIHRLEMVNFVLPEDRHLYASIGIGFGRILNIEDQDLFGDEVNLSCKLSEDIASRNAILLTERAYAQLPEPRSDMVQQELSLSGLSLVYYEFTR